MNKLNLKVALMVCALLLFQTAHAGLFSKKKKEPVAKPASGIAAVFQGQYAIPKLNLPRGTYMFTDGVVDFAELERQRLLNGDGPMKDTASEIFEVDARSSRVTFAFREPGKRPDPHGFAMVVKSGKKAPADLMTEEKLRGVLEQLFTLTNERPAPPAGSASQTIIYMQAPSSPAPPAAAPAPAAPDETKAAFEAGMSKKDLLARLGEPAKRDVSFDGDVVVEKLFYEFADHSSMLFVLRDGVVEQIKRF